MLRARPGLRRAAKIAAEDVRDLAASWPAGSVRRNSGAEVAVRRLLVGGVFSAVAGVLVPAVPVLAGPADGRRTARAAGSADRGAQRVTLAGTGDRDHHDDDGKDEPSWRMS